MCAPGIQLAAILRHQSRLDEARTLAESALERASKKLSSDHPKVLNATTEVALVRKAQGDLAEAESLLRSALERRSKLRGPDQYDRIWSVHHLAEVLRERGQLEEAARLGKEAAEFAAWRFGWRRALVRGSYGTTLVELERFEEAEELILGALEELEALKGVDPEKVRETAQRAVDLYEAWGKPEEAEKYRGLTATRSHRQ